MKRVSITFLAIGLLVSTAVWGIGEDKTPKGCGKAETEAKLKKIAQDCLAKFPDANSKEYKDCYAKGKADAGISEADVK